MYRKTMNWWLMAAVAVVLGLALAGSSWAESGCHKAETPPQPGIVETPSN